MAKMKDIKFQELVELRVDDILVGREVDKRVAISHASQYISDTANEEVERFYRLPKDEQEKLLREIFEEQLKRK
jgi:tRNA(Arg) A34 adenosine deaminase TadA